MACPRGATPDEHFLTCPDSSMPPARRGTASLWKCYPPVGSGDIPTAGIQITPFISAAPDEQLRACPSRRMSDSADRCVLRGERCPRIRFRFIKRACLQELSAQIEPSPNQHFVAYPDGEVAGARTRCANGRDGFPCTRYRRVDTTGVERLFVI